MLSTEGRLTNACLPVKTVQAPVGSNIFDHSRLVLSQQRDLLA